MLSAGARQPTLRARCGIATSTVVRSVLIPSGASKKLPKVGRRGFSHRARRLFAAEGGIGRDQVLRPVAAVAGAYAGAAALRRHGGSRGLASASSSSSSSSSSANVVIFSRAGCAYCARAKALLESRGVAFEVVDIGIEPDRRSEAQQLSGASTVPQVFIGRRCLGGFDALQRLDEVGALMDATRRSEEDGPPVTPTPAGLMAAATLPEAVSDKLASRSEAMTKVRYQAGSRPSLRSFLRYAVTSAPAQDQTGNVPLNLAAAPGEVPPPPALSDLSAGELVALLRQAMLQLLDKFADPSSGDVDYLSMRNSAEWDFFRALAAELGEPRLKDELVALDEEDRKAFFINLYNAMTFHGVVTFGRRPGWWYLYCFFITPAVSYRLAGFQVSLDDVEHGLLRAQPSYFKAEGQGLQKQLRMPEVDPRIHMALNCGARGCPAIAIYSGGTALSSELDEAVAGFVADDGNVRVAAGADERSVELALSSLFKMYIEDFAGPGAKPRSPETHIALVRWLLPFARAEKRELLERAASEGAPIKLDWLPYDWETNGSEVPLDGYIYTPTF